MSQVAEAQGKKSPDLVPPAIFQAAGPNIDSIQGTVAAFRVALGDPNNANNPGPLTSGRREINWDGGGECLTLLQRRLLPSMCFGQPGRPVHHIGDRPFTGSSHRVDLRAASSRLFNNPTYETIFSAFSPLRLFTPVGSNITEALFFQPGTSG